MSTLVQMCRRLVAFLGLTGPDGNLSFNKSVTAIMVATFVYAVVKNLDPSAALLAFGTTLVAAGFGIKALLSWFGRMTTATKITATSHTTLNVAEIIRALKAEPDYRNDDER